LPPPPQSLNSSRHHPQPKGAADWRYLDLVQPDLDAHARLILVDWLVDVCEEFNLGQGTLFLTVNLVDRYLSRAATFRQELQLLGVAALWLASKFAEAYPPVLADFLDTARHAYSAPQVVAMERLLLGELGFTLMVPTAHTFLGLFMPAAAANAADADAFCSAAIDGGGGSTAWDSDISGNKYSSGSSNFAVSPVFDSSSSGSSSCNGSGSSTGSGSSGASSARFHASDEYLPAADAPTGPRAAPRYPYATGSPCPVPAGRSLHAAPAPAVAAAALGEYPRRVAHLAEYLAELSLLTPECIQFPPSLVAAAALNLACSLLDAPPGTRARLAPAAEAAAAREGAGGEERLRACVGELQRMFRYASRAPLPPSVKAKYCSARRGRVATVPLPAWAADD
jgi:hypothetical protein